MGQTDRYGAVIIAYKHLMGHVRHNHPGLFDYILDLFRSGKDIG